MNSLHTVFEEAEATLLLVLEIHLLQEHYLEEPSFPFTPEFAKVLSIYHRAYIFKRVQHL